MTPSVFYAACLLIWRAASFRADACQHLKVSDRTLRRWLSGDEPIPAGVVSEIQSELCTKRDAIETVLKAIEL